MWNGGDDPTKSIELDYESKKFVRVNIRQVI